MNVYKLTLIAMLASLSVSGRIIFANIPNIQPSTAIIIITGFWLGPLGGVLVGLLTALLSNLVIGMGMWVVWQLVAWSIIGFGAGIIGKFWNNTPIWSLMVYGAFGGFFFGFIMAVTFRAAGQPFWAYYLAGIGFDVNHAISNVVVIGLLAPVLSRLFRRYETNLQVVS
ncbi:ECF transporter S component [Halobacillus litoralis]|uniref:ECF transporter S component n=1 Tax=Halobacillus litoralis TaxID=45668 RepID=UPI001CD28274|nr:ECF transporter S component [Halobacillus litoralis]MCA0970305.1 ECF transporter S component [Halobacillus litoralis]